MRPEQLRELMKQHFEMWLGDKFISAVSDIAERGGHKIYIKDSESRSYLIDSCRIDLVHVLNGLGYSVGYLGDSRLGEEEYIVVSWEK